jgi:hypothetical protein
MNFYGFFVTERGCFTRLVNMHTLKGGVGVSVNPVRINIA